MLIRSFSDLPTTDKRAIIQGIRRFATVLKDRDERANCKVRSSKAFFVEFGENMGQFRSAFSSENY